MNDTRAKLIRILQVAHAGELAAAVAYRGHWKSLRKTSTEREHIQKIEREEWEHRMNVLRRLEKSGANPNSRREKVFGQSGAVWTLRVTFQAGFSQCISRADSKVRTCRNKLTRRSLPKNSKCPNVSTI